MVIARSLVRVREFLIMHVNRVPPLRPTVQRHLRNPLWSMRFPDSLVPGEKIPKDNNPNKQRDKVK